MLHQLFWSCAEIVKHLDGFRILQPNMLFLTSVLVEEIMDELSKGSPLVTIAHDQEVISMGH